MYIVLRIIRGIVGLIAGWQILGLLPVIGWLADLGAVTGEMWAMLLMKAIVMLVFGSVFFGLRALINKLHTKQHGVLHPSLVSKWSL